MQEEKRICCEECRKEARRILSEMVMREIEPIGEALIAKAKKDDVLAVRELFDRAFGKASQTTKIDLNEGICYPRGSRTNKKTCNVVEQQSR